jgi:hypothetical protein
MLELTSEEMAISLNDFTPTDAGGCSFLGLEPIDAPNGTIIDYQVCFLVNPGEEYCKKDSFMIWGNTEEIISSDTTQQPEEQLEHQNEITIDTWELFPQISSTERQEIGACAHRADVPIPDLNTRLILETTDEGVLTYQGPATDPGGCAFFKLDPLSAKNGETIPYQACFTNEYGEEFCNQDSFLIWGNP